MTVVGKAELAQSYQYQPFCSRVLAAGLSSMTWGKSLLLALGGPGETRAAEGRPWLAPGICLTGWATGRAR